METPSTNTINLDPWAIRDGMKQARGVILVEGLFFLLCGLFAIVISPLIASTVLIFILGWIAVLCGVLLLVRSFTAARESMALTMINGILVGGLGVLFLVWPFESLEIVTLVLAGWCLLRGIMDLSGKPARSAVAPGMQFISGIISIILAIILVIWWPSDALWAPGLLFGIQLLFLGLAMLATWNALGEGGVLASAPKTTVVE